MQRSTIAKRVWLLLLAGAFFTYLYGLGAAPLVGADEPRYAQVAREMFGRGDFVTPTLAGLHWFEKPPLLYWLMMTAYAAFGVSESSARLGAALSGLAAVCFVWWLADRAESHSPSEMRGLGLVAAGVLASCCGMLVFSRGASFDAPLTASVTFALACLFISEIEAEGGRRRLLLAGFYVGVGLALLSKGLVGIVLPFGVAALYFVLLRRWTGFLQLGLWWGVPLALAVAGLWYAPVVTRHGWEFVEEFFVKHHFSRYVSNRYQHPQPFYFYIYVVPLLALPWTFFLVSALVGATRSNTRAEAAAEKLRAFSLAWLVVPVLFFSFSGSKLPGYILPALPGAALLAAQRLTLYLRGEGGTGVMRWTGALALAAGACGVAYALAFDPASKLIAAAVVLPSIVAGATCALSPGRREFCAAALVAGSLLTVVMIVTLALGDFARRESVRGLLDAASARGLGEVPVFELHTIERTAEFYAAGRLAYAETGQPLKLEGPGEVLDSARARGGRALVIVPLEYVYQLDNLPGALTQVVGDNGAHALVYVDAAGGG